MARRGFWDSFYQGFDQGDKIVERNRGLQQRAEFKKIAGEDQTVDTQYNPADFTDEAEKAGGTWSEADQAYKLPDGNLQAPTNTPTWDDATKTYQSAQGQSLTPKTKYTLGNKTQDVSFTPDDVQDYRNNKYADVYAANGDMDKAMGVRASAQSMKLGKVQLEQADAAGKEANNVRKLMKIQGEFLSGAMDPEEAIKQAIGIADKANGDGITFAYKPAGDGKFEITELRNDKVFGSKIVDPTTVLKEALKYSSPTMFRQMQEQDNSDRTFKQTGDQFSENVRLKEADDTRQQNQFNDTLTFNKDKDTRDASIKREEIEALRDYRRATLASRNSGGGLNAVQAYGLQQQQLYDQGRNGVMADLESGKITEVEASRKLKIMGMKFGAAGSPLQEPKEDSKLQDARIKFITENPDASPAQLENFEMKIGIRKPLVYAPPAQQGALAPKGLQAKPKLQDVMQAWDAETINKKLQNPLYDSVPITDADRVFGAKLINAKRAAEQLTPPYLR